MKVLALLVVVACVALQGSEAKMNAFVCGGGCFNFTEGTYCISDGTVICGANCLATDYACEHGLTSEKCTATCP